jgi:hypothetical protein
MLGADGIYRVYYGISQPKQPESPDPALLTQRRRSPPVVVRSTAELRDSPHFFELGW